MDPKETSRKGRLYKAYKYLAGHYEDFRYLNRNIGFGNAAKEVCETCSVSRAIADAIDRSIETISQLNTVDARIYKVTYAHYIGRIQQDIGCDLRSQEIGCSRNIYYRCLNYGTEIGARHFWSHSVIDPESPFYHKDADECMQVFNTIRNAMSLHNVNNYCYLETTALLENYVKFKCLSDGVRPMPVSYMVNRDFNSKLKEDAMQWKYRNMMDSHRISKKATYEEGELINSLSGYITCVDTALRRLHESGERGREAYDLLYISYLDVQFYQLKFSERIEISGYKAKTFYNRRQQAVKMLSEILWGPLGHRVRCSPYSVRTDQGTGAGEPFELGFLL